MEQEGAQLQSLQEQLLSYEGKRFEINTESNYPPAKNITLDNLFTYDKTDAYVDSKSEANENYYKHVAELTNQDIVTIRTAYATAAILAVAASGGKSKGSGKLPSGKGNVDSKVPTTAKGGGSDADTHVGGKADLGTSTANTGSVTSKGKGDSVTGTGGTDKSVGDLTTGPPSGSGHSFSDGIAFNANLKNHICKVDGFSQKKGVIGGHNLDAFNQVAAEKNLKILSSTEHPTIRGITQIEYQIPSFDRAGNITGYKKKPFTKTVYNAELISDRQILELGQQAASKKFAQAVSIGKREFISEAGGIKFQVYIKDGVIDNIFPMFGE